MSFTPPEIEQILLNVAVAGYAVAWWGYWRARRQEKSGHKPCVFTVIAFLAQLGSVTLRTYRAGHLPIYSAYEFSTIFAATIILVHLIFERLSSESALGLATLPVALTLLCYAWTLPKAIEPVIPIFRSFWLKVHVLTAFVAYSSLAVTLAASCLYLFSGGSASHESSRVNTSRLALFDRAAYQAAKLGFPFLTVCIISGAIWAEAVWGRFWSWDPKETWSLITWLVFAAYLHTRYHRAWSGRKAAVLGVVGFLFVLMTFVGVDYISPQQHDFLLWRKVGQ
ncbi:MAG: c-type cytochrome biogenesis protein CcsB [Alphaproteobacteria bacterium]